VRVGFLASQLPRRSGARLLPRKRVELIRLHKAAREPVRAARPCCQWSEGLSPGSCLDLFMGQTSRGCPAGRRSLPRWAMTVPSSSASCRASRGSITAMSAVLALIAAASASATAPQIRCACRIRCAREVGDRPADLVRRAGAAFGSPATADSGRIRTRLRLSRPPLVRWPNTSRLCEAAVGQFVPRHGGHSARGRLPVGQGGDLPMLGRRPPPIRRGRRRGSAATSGSWRQTRLRSRNRLFEAEPATTREPEAAQR
jgi:hypothetical protein